MITNSDQLRQYAATDRREPIAEDEFRARLGLLIGAARQGVVRRHRFITLPAGTSGWQDTGFDLVPGDAVTVFTTARAQLPRSAEDEPDPDLRFWRRAAAEAEARRGLWCRIGGDGTPRRSARASDTFVAEQAGLLEFASTPTAEFQPPPVDRCALIVQWATEPEAGLTALRVPGDGEGRLDSEIARYGADLRPPDGWFYPALAGDCEQFVADANASGDTIIGCYSADNGALLQREAPLAFVPGTRLRWDWRMWQLPSRYAEDRLHTHDYLSIAVEFDNGRDLTYCWSAELPVEYAYQCPVPGWADRETHVVIRTGGQHLGQWLHEDRDLYADYLQHVGEPPSQVARVWLLASTFRQHGAGQCDYARIELTSAEASLRVT